PSSIRRAIVVMSVTGVVGVDKMAVATGTVAAISSGNTATTAQADELLIGGIATEDKNGVLTPTNGFTLLASEVSGTAGPQQDNVMTFAIYRIVAATGAYAATGTYNSSTRPWAAAIATYFSAPTCGNGALDAGEQCDDGNTNNGDCCSS